MSPYLSDERSDVFQNKKKISTLSVNRRGGGGQKLGQFLVPGLSGGRGYPSLWSQSLRGGGGRSAQSPISDPGPFHEGAIR